MSQRIEKLMRPDGEYVAYCATQGSGPGIIYLSGFMSDMQGTKATALEEHCKQKGRPFIRFDYLGHGVSSGEFKKGTLGRWLDDSLAVIDELTKGPQILVGSSMGGWLMLLAAMKRPDRIKGLVGIATGADFTEDMVLARATDEMHKAWEQQGFVNVPVNGTDTLTFTKKLIEEARGHLVMRNPIPFQGKVHLLHGMQDKDVPYQNSLRVAELLESDDVTVTLVKQGGHRLSTPDQIQLMLDAVEVVGG